MCSEEESVSVALLRTSRQWLGAKAGRWISSNENKMSDGGRGRTSREVNVWKSSQMWSVQRSAVRSIAWLDLIGKGVTTNCAAE
jgi:hypothetical protein